MERCGAESQNSPSGAQRYTYNAASVVPFDLSYEVDIWGRVRREFEANANQAQATLADFENVLLVLRADVATNYFALRALDSEVDVQRKTIKAYQDNLNLTNSRFQGGISTELDVEQAKATLASAQAQLAAFQQKPRGVRARHRRAGGRAAGRVLAAVQPA